METYFAADGNYGEWDDLTCVIVDTGDFTEEHWKEIDECSDWQRPNLALAIRERLDSGE